MNTNKKIHVLLKHHIISMYMNRLITEYREILEKSMYNTKRHVLYGCLKCAHSARKTEFKKFQITDKIP